MQIKSIKTAPGLEGKTVFLRSDFNVPIKNGKIQDDYKILAGLATISFLSEHNCKIVIATHLGDQKKNNKKDFTTKPISVCLAKLLGQKVVFINDCVGPKVKAAIGKMKARDILVLENLRFYQEEEKNSIRFAKELASLADIYVNNAFAVCHRDHASVSSIKKFIPSFAGLLVEKEVLSLEKVMKPAKPMVVLMGGAKISTKLPLLENMAGVADHVLLGGALANTFLCMLGYEVGKSMAEKDDEELKKQLALFYKRSGNKKIILPIDAVVTKKIGGEIKVKSISNISKDDYIYDIGPKTIAFYAHFIKKAKTLAWNGPMGMFEKKQFKHGTVALGHIFAARSTGTAFGVVGGGETIEALKMTGMMDYVDWVSTGGGAMLSYLGGEKMPGLSGLIKK
jgi:phosphoglycerate kinase